MEMQETKIVGATLRQVLSGLVSESVPSSASQTTGRVSPSLLVSGTSGNDTLTGDVTNDTVDGGDGNDSLSGLDGHDSLIGGAGNDTLLGGAGSDTLDGGAGVDSMVGGAGSDVYIVDNVADLVVESAAGGNDTVKVVGSSVVSRTLESGVENLDLSGSSTALTGTGNELNNRLTGNIGANTLDGRAGGDSMSGGAGNDIYVVDNLSDRTVELANEGVDTVRATVVTSWTLGANLENLDLSTGSTTTGVGNAANNVLTGNGSANVLDGRGGNDTLIGGAGNDVYYVDSSGDLITELTGGGTDTVRTSVNFSLVTGDSIENVVLTGATALNIVGNELANALTGNTLANRLQGGDGADTLDGGEGNDTLEGGGGNDVFIVDTANDTVVELAQAGLDRIASSVTWDLGVNTEVEDLTLTGVAAISGTGNAQSNRLTGNDAANVLSGLDGADTLDGGKGDDTMSGGAGNDTFVVDAYGDVLQDTGGTDLVSSAVTWTLGADFENLTLTGAAAISGVGNGLANTLVGNDGANVLDGLAGADTMQGGKGNDTYIVDSSSDIVLEGNDTASGVDTVISSANYTLSLTQGIDNLTLVGAALTGVGNDLANTLLGNSGNNTLSGGNGNDRLDGGEGADSMTGGGNDDVYVVDSTGDRTIEAANGGVDRIESYITWDMATSSAEVEHLALIGTEAVDGAGNSKGNLISGNAAYNRLSGNAGDDTLVGSGTVALSGSTWTWTGYSGEADSMAGGVGADLFFVDSLDDLVVEVSTETVIDTVNTVVDWTLGANVENLTLLGGSALNGTGNALNNLITGNSGANVLNGGAGNDTLAGGDGNDTYMVDSLSDIILETSTATSSAADAVVASITWSLEGSQIEDLTLTGSAALVGTGNSLNNRLWGNSGANTLLGGEGNDTLDGGEGADSMAGGGGNDVYQVDNASDLTTELALGGTDEVRSVLSWTLAAEIENLTLLGDSGTAGDPALNGTGNASANRITGNDGSNVLRGLDGDDVLDGKGGADTLEGGLGNDVFVVDSTLDVLKELAGEGTTDTVQSSVSWTLGAEIEQLTLTGSSAINGTGNALNNRIVGNSGANVLNGGSGGVDTLEGGSGNDTYVVDGSNDIIVEASGGGTDAVRTSGTYSLTALTQIENLVLTGSVAINGTGNLLDNQLVGNSMANLLTGAEGNDTLDGGGGNDTLDGGAGNDTFVVDSLGDTIQGESAGTGNGFQDTVRSYLSWTLLANLENLTLQDGATGSASAINGTGNELANILIGNGAYNVLSGLEGNDLLAGSGTLTLSGTTWTWAGYKGDADAMNGGAGNDVYWVDSVGDVLTDNAGTDGIVSAVDWTLATGFENLALLLGSATALNGIGNTANNAITGNDLGNLIDGGAGADTLDGGKGNDTYVVDNSGDAIVELSGAGTDTVRSSVNFDLAGKAAQVENLTLTGSAANGWGTESDNVLIGNAQANSFSAAGGNDSLDGGLGNDTLIGGSGNDTYVVDAAGDVVTETSGGGTDTVESWVNVATLMNEVENLVLKGTAVRGNGNGLANRITGNDGDNSLSGGDGQDTLDGGKGEDSLYGGAGNDTFVVDTEWDVVVEATGAGTDTVEASLNWVLGSEVENLTLTGTSALNGTGNALGNLLTGNSGSNVLDGGAGADTLFGGTGSDTFVITDLADQTNDFKTSESDKLLISQSVAVIGDGDTKVDGAVTVAGGAGSFSTAAEFVVVTNNATGSTITAASAAAVIGGASSAYAVGDTRLFAVDNGSHAALFLFTSSGADATVSAAELTLITMLNGTSGGLTTASVDFSL